MKKKRIPLKAWRSILIVTYFTKENEKTIGLNIQLLLKSLAFVHGISCKILDERYVFDATGNALYTTKEYHSDFAFFQSTPDPYMTGKMFRELVKNLFRKSPYCVWMNIDVYFLQQNELTLYQFPK